MESMAGEDMASSWSESYEEVVIEYCERDWKCESDGVILTSGPAEYPWCLCEYMGAWPVEWKAGRGSRMERDEDEVEKETSLSAGPDPSLLSMEDVMLPVSLLEAGEPGLQRLSK